MPWPETDDWPEELYCELCEKTGHTLSSCPQRDDDDEFHEPHDQPLREPDLPPDAHLEKAYEDRFASDQDL